jgi:hypothetical protein
MIATADAQILNNNSIIYDDLDDLCVAHSRCDISIIINVFSQLIQQIADNEYITQLDIRIKLTREQLSELFKAIIKKNAIQELILRKSSFDNYDLSDELAHNKLARFLKTSSLKSLTLYNTGIDDNGAIALSSVLKKHNVKLKNLKISGHKIKQAGAVYLTEMLVFNKTLDKLEFYNDGINGLARLFLVAQFPYMSLSKIAIDGSFNSMLMHNCILSEEFDSFCDLPGWAWSSKRAYMDNPIKFTYAQKEQRENSFLGLLKSYNLDSSFIKRTRDLLYKFSNEEQELIRNYPSAEEEEEKIEYIRELYAGKPILEIQEISKLRNSFQTKRLELINKYNDLQQQYYEYLTGIEESYNQELCKSNLPVFSFEQGPSLVENDRVEPVIFSILTKYQAPVLIENIDLQNADLQSKIMRIINRNSEYVVLSVGSACVKSQQIPTFTQGMQNLSILNIDPAFTEQDLSFAVDTDDKHVDYHKEQIDDTKLTKIIKYLIKYQKKVILINNISPLAGCYQDNNYGLKDTISNFDDYGGNLVFINAYFKEFSAIICSCKLIKEYMSNDNKMNELTAEIYLPNQSQEKLNAIVAGKNYLDLGIFKNSLDAITYEDVLSMFHEPLCNLISSYKTETMPVKF